MFQAKKSLAVAASAILAAAAALLPISPAAADSSCPAGATCVWKDAGYYGGKFLFYRYVPDFRYVNLNDQISSGYFTGFRSC